MWRDSIAGWTSGAVFAAPASDAEIVDCETALGQALPAALAELLRESNGVEGEYGLGLIWPTERIATDNLHYRSDVQLQRLYMPFEPLLFFADAGNGEQFALVMRDNRADVFAWNHEDDSRAWVAPDLTRYLEWWLTGRIRL